MTEDSATYYSPEFIEWVKHVKMSKRARAAVNAMLEHGAVTTVELSEKYGLEHPPRAARDVIDAGINLERDTVKIKGKRIARYKLVDIINPDTGKPRRTIPKSVKDDLIKRNGYRCTACGGEFTTSELQVDHRIPYAIAGDPEVWSPETVMLLCRVDNRAKSWTCEHCPNWTEKDAEVCTRCYWSHPEGPYEHVAEVPERRLSVIWQGNDETKQYDEALVAAQADGETLQQLVKHAVADENQQTNRFIKKKN